jgi:hypothetical protein
MAAGAFFLVAGLLSDGPERVGGIVFGVLALAAMGAILYRRARDARARDASAAQSKCVAAEMDSKEGKNDDKGWGN